MSLYKVTTLLLSVIAVFATEAAFAQETQKKVNFRYSTNPPIRKAKPKKAKKKTDVKKNGAAGSSTKAVKKDSKNGSDKNKAAVTKKAGGRDRVSSNGKPKISTDRPEINKETSDGTKIVDGSAELNKIGGDASLEGNGQDEGKPTEELTIAKNTREIAKKAAEDGLKPTEVYSVGFGDVLLISLQNSGAKSSRYYTVLKDGTIDYPLAGELVNVTGLTTDKIEELLREKIKLYENPEVSVRVREHASHKIFVLGLVEKPGEKYLQRDAIPLYVIKAEAIVRSESNHVIVRRRDLENHILSFSDDKADGFLVYPGDIIEFGKVGAFTDPLKVDAFYYVGGFVRQFGKREYTPGITLTQAILASGGLRNSRIRKVVVRRRNDKGLLKSIEYDLKEIKKGKTPDPDLEPGDTIEAKY